MRPVNHSVSLKSRASEVIALTCPAKTLLTFAPSPIIVEFPDPPSSLTALITVKPSLLADPPRQHPIASHWRLIMPEKVSWKRVLPLPEAMPIGSMK